MNPGSAGSHFSNYCKQIRIEHTDGTRCSTTADRHFFSTSFQFIYRTRLFYNSSTKKFCIVPHMDTAIVQRKIQVCIFFRSHLTGERTGQAMEAQHGPRRFVETDERRRNIHVCARRISKVLALRDIYSELMGLDPRLRRPRRRPNVVRAHCRDVDSCQRQQ